MGSPLRVLHVVVNMNRGGAETLIMNLYRNMDRSKVQFDFLTCKEGIFDSEIIAMGGKVHRIPYITEIGHKGYIHALEKFLKTNSEYKIIHSHMDKMSGFVLRSARKTNVPIRIAHSHNTKSEGGMMTTLYKWYGGRFIKSNATHQYACSYAAAKWLYGDEFSKALILKNGIEPDKFQYTRFAREHIRRELKIGSEALVLGHVGRFSHQKNHLFLLEVFARISMEVPNAVLILAGDGPLKSTIIEKAKKLNIDKKVKLIGVREDINLLLQSFDVFVFPSLHEGLPVTLIEAQGAGLPCVISNRISMEVDMGIGLVHYLSITNQKNWLDTIVNLAKDNKSRTIPENALSQNGYDIRKTAALTETSYLSLGQEVI